MPVNYTESFLLKTPNGQLEVICEKPINYLDSLEISGIAVICHPHPLHGGTMNNKVVTTTAKAFREKNRLTIRFNFRGVGKSEGQFDQGKGEKEDTLAVIKWARENYPHQPLSLAGFSFGAYIALKAACELSFTLQQLILIAPAVNHADFSGLTLPCPCLILVAENDTVVYKKDIYNWLKKENFNIKPSVLFFPKASHFFDGQLIELKKKLMLNMSENF